MANSDLPVILLRLDGERALTCDSSGSWLVHDSAVVDTVKRSELAAVESSISAMTEQLILLGSDAEKAHEKAGAAERRADVLLAMVVEAQAKSAALEQLLDQERLRVEALKWKLAAAQEG